uniref:Uncharacterized protein n=4 Tax=Photinus pyralis TaxID=7054 RepID=A0A1Y1LW81_PHOPY
MKVEASSSSTDSAIISARSDNQIHLPPKYCKYKESFSDIYKFSPTKSSNDEIISDNSLNDEAHTNWYRDPQIRPRTMSECADSVASYSLQHGTPSASANSLCSPSMSFLSRQNALDSEEYIADVYCDPETRV